MYITNIDQVIPILRTKLDDYLVSKNIKEPGSKKFLCFVHEDHSPSMALNPKTGQETAHCFSCGTTIDIFSAASKLDNLPDKGPDFIQTTVPFLAEKLGVKVRLGTPSISDQEKLSLYRLAQDIADVIESPKYANREYIQERNWANELETCSSIDETELIDTLVARGWSIEEINNSLLVRTSKNHFFGKDKVTFVIRDFRSRPVGFISRNLGNQLPKYINSTETLIYSKAEMPLGLDKALKEAKRNGLYLVEGPGDRAQLLRLGIYNVIAVNGTAVTTDLLNLLKTLGIKNLYFCLDWDNAGVLATSRIFQDSLKNCPGLHCYIVEPPQDMGSNTDPDSYLKYVTDPNKFLSLPKTSAFSWVMKNISDTDSPEAIAEAMIPIIAAESTAIKRELLVKELQEFTGLTYQAIAQDVNSLRNHSQEQRKERILSATNQFFSEVQQDHNSLQVSLAKFESYIDIIEQEYDRDSIGVNYQLSRYDAIQLLKKPSEDGIDRTGFKMNHYKFFEEALSGAMPWSTGTLIYFGGRANSGKTATTIALALDIILSDSDTMCVMHFTDDSYTLVEPRIKSNIGKLINKKNIAPLSIGQTANPHFNISNKQQWNLYNEVDETLRNLITSERLVIIDSEDGPTLAPLEKTLRYLRQRYPEKKLIMVCDKMYCRLSGESLNVKACNMLETPKALLANWLTTIGRESRNNNRDCTGSKDLCTEQWAISSQASA